MVVPCGVLAGNLRPVGQFEAQPKTSEFVQPPRFTAGEAYDSPHIMTTPEFALFYPAYLAGKLPRRAMRHGHAGNSSIGCNCRERFGGAGEAFAECGTERYLVFAQRHIAFGAGHMARAVRCSAGARVE